MQSMKTKIKPFVGTWFIVEMEPQALKIGMRMGACPFRFGLRMKRNV